MDGQPCEEVRRAPNGLGTDTQNFMGTSSGRFEGSGTLPINFDDPTKLGPLEETSRIPTNRKSLIYRTTAQDIGSLPPTKFEMPTEWHGRTFAFSKSLGDTNIQNQGMNTTLDRGRFIDIK